MPGLLDIPSCPSCKKTMRLHCKARSAGWCGWFTCDACGVIANLTKRGVFRFIAERRGGLG